jgi:hypothetical protein
MSEILASYLTMNPERMGLYTSPAWIKVLGANSEEARHMAFMVWLSECVVKDKVSLNIGTSNLGHSFVHHNKDGSDNLIFGWLNVTGSFKHGFKEYKSIADIWGNYADETKLTGVMALWAIVLHETAHIFQGLVRDSHGLKRHIKNHIHDATFTIELYKLIEKYDFLAVIYAYEHDTTWQQILTVIKTMYTLQEK